MSSWPGPISAITLFVEDLQPTKEFYREVFGLPIHFEDEASVVFNFGLGVELLNGPMDRPWGIRTASFKDPAGHIWEIAT